MVTVHVIICLVFVVMCNPLAGNPEFIAIKNTVWLILDVGQ
jgi:hypothetical protein